MNYVLSYMFLVNYYEQCRRFYDADLILRFT